MGGHPLGLTAHPPVGSLHPLLEMRMAVDMQREKLAELRIPLGSSPDNLGTLG